MVAVFLYVGAHILKSGDFQNWENVWYEEKTWKFDLGGWTQGLGQIVLGV